MSRTRMTTLIFILSKLFPLDVSDAISCPLHNLKTVWNIIMILHSYVERCVAYKNDNSHCYTFELSTLDGYNYNALYFKYR